MPFSFLSTAFFWGGEGRGWVGLWGGRVFVECSVLRTLKYSFCSGISCGLKVCSARLYYKNCILSIHRTLIKGKAFNFRLVGVINDLIIWEWFDKPWYTYHSPLLFRKCIWRRYFQSNRTFVVNNQLTSSTGGHWLCNVTVFIISIAMLSSFLFLSFSLP